MKKANYAPAYACFYPDLAEIARAHGYALSIHGSLSRDFDLVCIPWTIDPADPEKVVEAICTKFAITKVDGLVPQNHGRLCQTLSVMFGECFLDLSFMPRVPREDPCPAPTS